MRILLAAPEAAPYADAGGLGTQISALAHALSTAGAEVCVAIPGYAPAQEAGIKLRPAGSPVEIALGAARVQVRFLHGVDKQGIEFFQVDAPGFFDRPGIYGENGTTYQDNAGRFLLFSKAVVELVRRIRPVPQVLHLHDWGSAPAAVFAKAARIAQPTVLTVHSLDFQGTFAGYDFALTNLGPEYYTTDGFEFYGGINFLKAGILHASSVTVPSELGKLAALTPEGGRGLEGALRARGTDVRAVQHGCPAAFLAERKKSGAAARAKDRRALLRDLDLAPDPEGPVFFMKDPDADALGLLAPVLDRLLADDVRLVVQGDPGANVRGVLEVAVRRYPGKLAWPVAPEHFSLCLAGCDCGLLLNQPRLDAFPIPSFLASGVVPVARALPGLHTILRDYDPTEDRGWSFLFYQETPEAFYDAIRRVKRVHSDTELWGKLVSCARKHAPDWERTASEMLEVYRTVGAE